MLTIPELTDAPDALRQAESLAAHVRGVFLSAGYIQGARILGDVLGLLFVPAAGHRSKRVRKADHQR